MRSALIVALRRYLPARRWMLRTKTGYVPCRSLRPMTEARSLVAQRTAILRGIGPLLSLCCACASGGPAPEVSSPATLAGTYDLSICNGGCADDSAAVVRGVLVLGDRPLDLAAVPGKALAYFEEESVYLLHDDLSDNSPNACFVLQRDSAFRGFAGLTPVALTRWERSGGDTSTVRLDQSPDAGYGARIVVRDGELSGSGTSWWTFEGRGSSPDDEILGERIGPPDFTRCFRAAEERASQAERLP